MSGYLAGRIEKPKYFSISPLIRGRSKRRTYVLGFDSEGDPKRGKPFLYQLAHPTEEVELHIVPDNGQKYETLIPLLCRIREITTRKDTEYLIFGFNLQYEYTQLFRDFPSTIYSEHMIIGEGDLPKQFNADGTWDSEGEHTTVKLEAMNYKREAITLRFSGRKNAVRIIDAAAFVSGSLDNVAQMLGLGRKDNKPETWGRHLLDDPEFLEYARQDARLTQKIGEWIVNLHVRFDVSQCISAPHFASKVFRRRYLTQTVEAPSVDLEQLGLWSYHGGKNGYYHHKPDVFKSVCHVDIRSAYPEAMKQLPDIEKGEWRAVEGYVKGVHAIWEIEGKYKRCKYRGLMDNKSWPVSGELKAVVTGYELDAALEHGEIILEKCEGYVFEGPEGGPLGRYVDDFFEMKATATDDTERLMAKLFLNSLYGKFFQKTEVGSTKSVNLETLEYVIENVDEDIDWKAGGLYHPPIASLITGFVRARIHNLEHAFRAIMTSTDGFFSMVAPAGTLIGKKLGNLSVEMGRLKIWRDRLYIFDPKDGSKPVYALHGWHSNLEKLRRVPLTAGNLYHYTAQAMVTLRMSKILIDGNRYNPGTFIQRPFTLRLVDEELLE